MLVSWSALTLLQMTSRLMLTRFLYFLLRSEFMMLEMHSDANFMNDELTKSSIR